MSLGNAGYGVIIGEGAAHDLVKAVAATGPGAPRHVIAKDKSFQAILTGTATVVVEGSNDPQVALDVLSETGPDLAVWVPIRDTGDPATAPDISFTVDGGQSNDEPWKWVRANVTAFTSGTVSVYMAT